MPRNSSQDKRLSDGDIALLKRNGIDPEEVKGGVARRDLFKDQFGDVFVKPKDGSGPGEPTEINLKALE